MSGISLPGFGNNVLFTKHFLISIAPDAAATSDAVAAVEAIAASCENDLATLSGWFVVNWDDAPEGIWVSIGDDGNASPHAWNTYPSSDSPHIEIYGATMPNAGNVPPVRDELARMLFVAELAETLMRFSGRGWNPENSAGEALSRVAGAELHPTGYYNIPALRSPYNQNWLKLLYRTRDGQDEGAPGPRYDFITISENTDQDAVSIGCGILFLYYLHSQLKYSWNAIATTNGAHLGQAFEQLTARPAHSAYTEFADVLDPHLPPGTSVIPATENVFPLRQVPPVLFYSGTSSIYKGREPELRFIELQAGPRCKPATYTYHNTDLQSTITVTARAPGSFAPSFGWIVAGTKLPFNPLPQKIAIPVTVITTVPGNKQPPAVNTTIIVTYQITNFSNSGQLTITNNEGQYIGITAPIEIKAVLGEAAVDVIPGLRTGVTSEKLVTRGFDLDARWAADLGRCGLNLSDRVKDAQEVLSSILARLHNLPDPPPPELLDTLVRAAVVYQAETRELLGETGLPVASLAQLLSQSTASSTLDRLAIRVAGPGQSFSIGQPVQTPQLG
jgi:hypothetical protein